MFDKGKGKGRGKGMDKGKLDFLQNEVHEECKTLGCPADTNSPILIPSTATLKSLDVKRLTDQTLPKKRR